MSSNDAFTLTSQRILADPGLPLPNPTQAHWQLPAHSLSTIQSTSLQPTTDILILGSGITGCSISKHLLSLTESSSTQITILEARTITSGATGRNGGHIATHPIVDYGELIDVVGKEETGKIMRFRLAHYGMMYKEMESLGKEALERSEVREVESCVGLLSESTVGGMKKLLEGMERDFPEFKDKVKVYQSSDPEFKTYQMSGVAGIAVERNGAVWPYRMVTSIFEHLISSYPSRFRIETQTPALSINYNDSPSEDYPYEITTPRGIIKAKQIVHATNGFTGHLLPNLRGKIFPCKGHMSVQVPGSTFPRKGDRSWSIVYDNFGLDYITQNPSTGELWYGGGLIRGKDGGLDAFGDSNDEIMDTMTRIHLQGAGPIFFGKENWGSEKGGEERVKAEWSGVMGFTADELPLVGQLPGSISDRKGKGEWIAAGFNGYGMPNCWGSGKALAEMMVLGKAGEEFPRTYLITEERLERMKGENAIAGFMGLEL